MFKKARAQLKTKLSCPQFCLLVTGTKIWVSKAFQISVLPSNSNSKVDLNADVSLPEFSDQQLNIALDNHLTKMCACMRHRKMRQTHFISHFEQIHFHLNSVGWCLTGSPLSPF